MNLESNQNPSGSGRKYVFKPYNVAFPHLFEAEKARLALEEAVEHVGSTAVPGLGGKGIIDIAIGTVGGFEKVAERLKALGYEFRESFSTKERLYFVIDLPDKEEGVRRYHVHLVHLGGSEWRGLLGFRDWLRGHPEEAPSMPRSRDWRRWLRMGMGRNTES